jgi:hypothetical protein
VVSLLAEDEAEPSHVVTVELAVAAVRSVGVDEPLALQEADLRH